MNLFTKQLSINYTLNELLEYIVESADKQDIQNAHDNLYENVSKIGFVLGTSPEDVFAAFVFTSKKLNLNKQYRYYHSRQNFINRFGKNSKKLNMFEDLDAVNELAYIDDKSIGKIYNKKNAALVRKLRRKESMSKITMGLNLFEFKIFKNNLLKQLNGKKLSGSAGIMYLNRLNFNIKLEQHAKEAYAMYLKLIFENTIHSNEFKKHLLSKSICFSYFKIDAKLLPYVTKLSAEKIIELDDDDSFNFELSSIENNSKMNLNVINKSIVEYKFNLESTESNPTKSFSNNIAINYLLRTNAIQNQLTFKSKILNKINKYVIANSDLLIGDDIAKSINKLTQIKETYDSIKQNNS